MDFKWFLWFSVLFFTARSFSTAFDSVNGISPDDGLLLTQHNTFKEIVDSRLSSWKTVQDLLYRSAIPRQKRGVLFSSGVKPCTQESLRQAVENHLNYFNLRVCQETVWEAFKIFWDRLPEQSEYRHWITICLEGAISISDIGTNFSESEEHIALLKRRMSMNASFSSKLAEDSLLRATSPSPTQEGQKITVTEEISPKAILGAMPEPTPDVFMGFMMKSKVLAGQEVMPDLSLGLTTERTPDVTIGTNPEEVTHWVSSESSLEISPEGILDVTKGTSPQAIPQDTVKVTQKHFTEIPVTVTQKVPRKDAIVIINEEKPSKATTEFTPLITVSPERTPEMIAEANVMQDITSGSITAKAAQEALTGVNSKTATATPGTTVKDAVGGQARLKQDENMIPNEIDDIARKPAHRQRKQLVELRVQLKGENYDDTLKDPSSPAYRRLAQQFAEKIADAFGNMPGFKDIYVLEFRKQKNFQRMDTVVVRCAVSLDTSPGGISDGAVDSIGLRSNMVERSHSEPDEHPVGVHTATDLLKYIAEALHKDNFTGTATPLVEPTSLELESGTGSSA